MQNARADLFEGARWYLTPTERSSGLLYDRLQRAVAGLGARPQAIDAATHDRLMATVSHLPHVVANVLVGEAAAELTRDSERMPEVGPSFRDMTRVAGSNPAIWGDIFATNREAVAEAVDSVIERLREAADADPRRRPRGQSPPGTPRRRGPASGCWRPSTRPSRTVTIAGDERRSGDPLRPLRPAARDAAPAADKSISHRAALIAAMGEGETTIEGYLDAADTRSTLAAVAALGAQVEGPGATGIEPTIRVRGVGLRGPIPASVDVGNAGTLLRLLPGWLAGQETGAWTLDGDDSIRRRPVDRIVEPLRSMGAQLRCRDDRLPPLEIEGAPLHGVSYELPVASAQVKSCLLFAGLLAEGDTAVTEPLPTRDHTERMLAAAGVEVDRHGDAVTVRPAARLEPGEIVVPGDFSSAAFFVVAALLVPGSEADHRRRRPQPDPHRPAGDPRADGSRDRDRARGRARRRADRAGPRPPRGAARRRGRWRRRARSRSTSCRSSLWPPASPRGRRRSATRPSCGARSPTGSPP